MQIEIWPYDPSWPTQFERIKRDLTTDLHGASLPLLAIEHIGSTSIPLLASKPIIDILIIIPPSAFTPTHLPLYTDALTWGPAQPGYHYIGTGGVRDRWSFKLNGVDPPRNVYVAAQDSLPVRSCIAFRDCLRGDEGLREEYGAVKMGLCAGGREWGDVMQYSRCKDVVVRKVLRAAGWSGEMVDEKERGCVEGWEDELEVLDLRGRGCWGCVGGWCCGVVRRWWGGGVLWMGREREKVEGRREGDAVVAAAEAW